MVDQKKTMSAAEAVKLAAEARKSGAVHSADLGEYDADGFRLVRNKASLVGKGFLIISVDFSFGEWGEQVEVIAVTNTGKAFKLTDASTGIYKQLSNYTGDFPVAVNKGLRVSEYTGPDGRPAKTFYLDDETS